MSTFLLFAASADAQQAGPNPETPATVLAAARALHANGDPSAALARLDRYLAGPGRRAGQPDQAILRLEAARAAVGSRQPDQARAHLAIAETIAGSTVFRPYPLLAARLRRELARQRESIGDMAKAEALLSGAIPVLEPQDPVAAAEATNARGVVRLELLKLSEAQADFGKALQLAERSQALSALQVTILTNMAMAAAERGNVADARAAADQVRRIAGMDSALLRVADFANAQVLARELDIVTAEGVLLHVSEQTPSNDALRGHALISLANARFNRGRMAEAAESASLAVEAYRASIGEFHPAYGRALHVLGVALGELGDTASAIDALDNAVRVMRGAFGANAVQAHVSDVERAWLDIRTGDPASGERRAMAALRAYATTPPPDSRPIGFALVVQAMASEAGGHRERATDLYRQGQARIAEARGPNTPDLGFSLVRLGRLLTRMGRHDDAGPPLDRAIAIYEAAGGAGTVRLADALTARAELRAVAGAHRGALEDARRAFALLQERVGSVEQAGGASASAQRRGARELYAAQARLLLNLEPGSRLALEEAFIASQESVASRAGEALRRSALRRASAGGELGQLVADREAAIEVIQQVDALILASATSVVPMEPREIERLRSAREGAALRARALSATIEERYPRFGRYLQPRPEGLGEVQALLAEDEVIVAPIVTADGVLVWGIRRRSTEAAYLPVGSSEVAALVQRVRSGVDLGLEARGRRLEPFDLTAAKALHDIFFQPLERIGFLEGAAHVVFVPDGAMQSLPPHLLVDDQQRWLVKRFAFTISPTIGSWVVSREGRGRPSNAEMSFLGVGDPDFAGFGQPARVPRRGPPERLRRELSQLARLPDTGDEIRRLAEVFGMQRSRLLLGDQATERALMNANPNAFRVLSFSTHALMAGELPGLMEPVIVLTPTDDEAPLDGLLTSSDVAAMELDADLVLLSACNTAAPDGGPYAEGMSGLARAFLQAGARSLLVSHWSVASDATVRLTTEFAERLASSDGLRHAEALRAAILGMIDGDDPAMRHPAVWSPFVVVGG